MVQSQLFWHQSKPLTLYCSPAVSIMRVSAELLGGKDILRKIRLSLSFSVFCLIKKLESLVLVNLGDVGVDGDPVCVWKTSALWAFVKLLNYSLPQFPCQYHGERASQVALLVKNLPTNAGDIRNVGSGRSPGGGNGNPLQYSCLENPTDRGAWQATVHRVTKRQIILKWLSMHACTWGKPEYPGVWLLTIKWI